MSRMIVLRQGRLNIDVAWFVTWWSVHGKLELFELVRDVRQTRVRPLPNCQIPRRPLPNITTPTTREPLHSILPHPAKQPTLDRHCSLCDRNPLLCPIAIAAMFLQRSAVLAARRAAVAPVLRRSFATTVIRREWSGEGRARPIGTCVLSPRWLARSMLHGASPSSLMSLPRWNQH